MSEIVVNASIRKVNGSGESKRLRRNGKVPGTLYGDKDQAKILEFDHQQLTQHLKNESFQSSILKMNLEGKEQNVLVREIQFHPWKKQVLHVDFQRVSEKQKITIKVPLHFLNEDIAHGVKIGGGIISHVLNEIEISCVASNLPEYIEIDLKDLELNQSIHLSDVKFPEGVECPQILKGDNVVVSIQKAKVVKADEIKEDSPESETTPKDEDKEAKKEETPDKDK